MKPKEYLRSIGIETGGRGRMPAAHKAKIQEAVNDGVAIEGYSSTGAADASGVREVVRVTADVTGIADIGMPTRDENALTAKLQGRVIGMRSVCTCGNSLTYCHCPSPTMWVDGDIVAEVKFSNRPAGSPPVNRWW